MECRIHQSQLPIRSLAVANRQSPRLASGPPAPRSRIGGGGRNALGSSRALAPADFPRQFTLENHRLPLALPQSSGKRRNLHVSLATLSATSLRAARTKPRTIVQKLWTM